MATETVRFGPFVPDLPILGSPGSKLIKNVIPIKGGYAPARKIAPFTEALPTPALASRYVKSTDGTVLGIVGTVDALREVRTSTFNDLSRTEGYNTSDDNVWSFVQIGDNLFATNFDDPIQQFNLRTSGNFADIEGDAPQAKFIDVFDNFMVLAHINDQGVVQPSTVRWSSNNQPTNFPAPGSTDAVQTLSGAQPLATDYGDITGMVTGMIGSGAIVLQERGVWKMNFVGGRSVFKFDLIEGARGCNSPGSVVQVGGNAFYLDDVGVFQNDGQQSVSIGSSEVDDFLYENIATVNLAGIRSAADVRKKDIYWSLPAADSSKDTDITLVYNYDIGEWSYLDAFKVQAFTRTFSTGFTLEDIDALSDSIDTLGASLDSDIFKGGGLPVFSAFDDTNKLGPFEGETLPATVLTAEVEPIPDSRYFLEFTRPLIDTESVTVTPYVRERAQDDPVKKAPIQLQADGRCPHRIHSRFTALQMDVPAGANWTSTQGIQATYKPSGLRAPAASTSSGVNPGFMLTDGGVVALTDAGFKGLFDEGSLEVELETFFLVTSEGDQLITSTGDQLVLSGEP